MKLNKIFKKLPLSSWYEKGPKVPLANKVSSSNLGPCSNSGLQSPPF